LSDFNVERSKPIERLERFKQSFGYLPFSMLTTMGERWAISHCHRVLSQSGGVGFKGISVMKKQARFF
jgi:hypothetical protein